MGRKAQGAGVHFSEVFVSDSPIKLFISYAHEDEAFQQELVKHLSNLQTQGVIEGWHDRQIIAGQQWADKIDTALNNAQIILLLISASFMASKYCREIEMRRAMERHEANEAIVIPILIRQCDWAGAPFSKLQAHPQDTKPVQNWTYRDDAWTDVVLGIRKAIESLLLSGQDELKATVTEAGLAEGLAKELVELLAKVATENWAAIYAQCKGLTGSNSPANIWRAARELFQLNDPQRGLHFITGLGRKFQQAEFTDWVKRANKDWKVSIDEPISHTKTTIVLFQVEPLASPPETFHLHAWLWQGQQPQDLTDPNQTPRDWPTIADEIQDWITFEQSQHADLVVELALPRTGFCCDITQWEMTPGEILLRQLQVIFRCQKRFQARRQKIKEDTYGVSQIELQRRALAMRKGPPPVLLEDWEKKCLQLREKSQTEASHWFYYLDSQRDINDLKDDFRNGQGLFVAFGCKPDGDNELSVFWRALDYGAPLVIWFREHPMGELKTAQDLLDALALETQTNLGDLPHHLWELQKAALKKKDRTSVHHHLTILYDDYERVPAPQ